MPEELDLEKLEKKLQPEPEKAPAGLEVEAGTEKAPAPPSRPEKAPAEFEKIKEGQGPEGAAAMPAAIQRHHSHRQKQIEKVLAQDLEEAYLNMSPEKQREFRQKGEETAREINTLLDKTKVKVKKVISLIKKWLSLIPGINKFFLEQETKIKADEIIRMRDR